jgi:hypothetical protein
MRVRHPPFYVFSHGLWNKNANPVTWWRRAAMMELPPVTGISLAKIAKNAK